MTTSERIEITAAGGPEVLALRPFTLPPPAPDEVRVRVLRAGVSFGDILLQRHVFRDVPAPAVPGYDVVGVIEESGAAATAFAPGERVAAFVEYGGYSRHVNVPARSLVRLPPTVELSSASAVILNYATAARLLDAARLRPGDTFLIHGATGGVGSAVVDVARTRGLRALGTARRLPATMPRDVLLFDAASPTLARDVRAASPEGLAAVLDSRAGRGLWQSRRLLRRGGVLVSFGLSSAASRGVGGRLAMLGSLATLGLFLVLPGKRLVISAIDRAFRREPERIRDLVRDLVGLLARDQIAPQIGLELPLERAAEAHALLQRGAVAGKIVLRLD